MLRVTLTVEGEAQFDRALHGLRESYSDLRPAFQAVVTVLRQHAERQFASEGSSGESGSWKSLSPKYAARKQRRFPGRPILEASGAMKRSLTGVTEDSLLELEPLALAYGSRKPIAGYHQRGSGRLPRRPIISLTESDKRAIVKAMQRELVRQAKAEGFEVQE